LALASAGKRPAELSLYSTLLLPGGLYSVAPNPLFEALGQGYGMILRVEAEEAA